jgi:hypothetical protein
VSIRAPISRSRIAAGFTLLEAILALGILAAATIVSLDIRAQMLRSGTRLREVQREDRDHEALFEMLVSGMLDEPRIDEERGYIWEGEFLGAKYRITRSVTTVPNPMVGEVAYEVYSRVPVIEYRIEHRDRTSTFLWHE